jgi:hypothetical protein
VTAASSLPPSTRPGTPARSTVTPTIVHEHARKRPKGKAKLTEGTGQMPGERVGGFIIPNRRPAEPVDDEPDEIA